MYQSYIGQADIDHREWQEMNADSVDTVKLNLNLFGCLANVCMCVTSNSDDVLSFEHIFLLHFHCMVLLHKAQSDAVGAVGICTQNIFLTVCIYLGE